MTPRVLVVEDDPDTLKFWACCLRLWGYEVDEAANGREALERVAAHCPQVVISDLVMPGMSGIELLRAVRAQDPDCVIFFVLITGYGTGPNSVRAIREGADDVLLKPVDPEQVRELLERHAFKVST